MGTMIVKKDIEGVPKIEGEERSNSHFGMHKSKQSIKLNRHLS